MVNISCPLCKETKSEIIFKNNFNYQIVKCEACNHIYTKFENEVDIELLYNEGVYKVIDNRKSVWDKILSLEYNAILKKINAFQTPEKIMDFGCGKGKFLSIAKRFGWDPYGVETSIPRAQFAIDNYGINVSNKLYVQGCLDNSPYNAITLFHVLEHLDNPFDLLSNLLNVNLKNNGLLVIEVPNISSLQSKIAKHNWMHYDLPKHLSHFNKSTLSNLVNKLGYKIVETEFLSFHNGVLGMLHAIFSRLGYRKNIIFDLKNKKPKRILFFVFLFLPFAFILEILAVNFKSGGVIRVYCKKCK